jgi:hypothetical protein
MPKTSLAPKRAKRARGPSKKIETVDITPSPRILKVIAEIDFRPWQCIAELIDNSFDEFLAIKRSEVVWDEPHEVAIRLPSQNSSDEDRVISVRDNGRGMTLTDVRNAVRAGFTGNDPLSNLGLFGMGFNVSTARLGGLTRFLTTREGDADWVGVEIDVDNMGEAFRAPVIREPKDTPAEHGTRVDVRRLTPFARWLTRPGNQTRLRSTLGEIYAHLLVHEKFRLNVNTIPVQAWQHCIWKRSRTVTRDGEAIPAVIRINRKLGERAVCKSCGTWQEIQNTECEQCGASDLDIRDRRVWGWVGISRNLDSRNYGIDFLRNGRKILRFDKTIFQWRDPDDPGGEGEIEYPIEPPANQGRIVGEIHVDHVRVSYTKDAFDSTDPSWSSAVRIVRGDGPLLPRKAKAAGYSPNNSPLARLHKGFRRNDPGRNYLTPGNGKARLDTGEWVRSFHFGDPDHQSDEKWWEAVEEHDRIARALKRSKEDEGEKVKDPTGEFIGDGEGEPSGDHTDGSESFTDEERLALLLKDAVPIPDLTGELSVSSVGVRPLVLRSFIVRGHELSDSEGRRVPVWVTSDEGGGLAAFADLDHPHFERFDDEPEDIILIDVGQNLLIRARGATTTLSAVYTELKDRYLIAFAIDAGKLIGEGTQLLRDIQDRMVDCVSENPERPWANALVEAERHVTRERMTQGLKTADLEPYIYSGDYLMYLPPALVSRVVEDWPEAFLDGKLFKSPYADVKEPGARRQMVASVTGYIDDVAWLAGAPLEAPRDQMIRARVSLQFLHDELT